MSIALKHRQLQAQISCQFVKFTIHSERWKLTQLTPRIVQNYLSKLCWHKEATKWVNTKLLYSPYTVPRDSYTNWPRPIGWQSVDSCLKLICQNSVDTRWRDWCLSIWSNWWQISRQGAVIRCQNWKIQNIGSVEQYKFTESVQLNNDN